MEKEKQENNYLENDERDNIINNSYSEEDSIREELRYKLNK